MSFHQPRRERDPNCDHPDGYEMATSNSQKNPGREYKKCRAAGCFIGWADASDFKEKGAGHKRQREEPPAKKQRKEPEEEQAEEVEELKTLLKTVAARMEAFFTLVKNLEEKLSPKKNE